jgi:hypothetical protein
MLSAAAGCSSGSSTTPTGLRLQLIDLLGCFGFREVRLDRFVRFFRERLEIGFLGAGDFLVTRDPVIRVFDAVRILAADLI